MTAPAAEGEPPAHPWWCGPLCTGEAELATLRDFNYQVRTWIEGIQKP